MLINRANLIALNATFSGVFQSAFEKVAVWSDPVTTEVPQSNVKGIYGFAAVSAGVREWIGERMSIAVQAHSYELPHKKFEYTFKVPRSHIIRDSLGIYTSMVIPSMAENVKKHKDQQIVKSIIQANPNGFDGVPFFGSNHPTYNGSGTYVNEFTLDASTPETLADEIGRLRSSMMTIVGEDGITLASNLTLILTTAKHEMLLRKALFSTTIPSGNGLVDNPLVGLFKLQVVPDLDAIDPDVIYFFDVSRAIKPFLWQIGSRPVFRSFTVDPNNMHSFLTDEYIYGIDGDNGGAYEVNAGVTLPFLAAKATIDLGT